jgi:MtfA peptidase
MSFDKSWLALLPILLVACAFAVSQLLKRWKRRRLLQRPFPAEWQGYLRNKLPVYEKLSPKQQHHLHQMIHLFIAEKEFYGCADLAITDEIRICIAAQACLLLLGRQGALYPRLSAILVYPTSFIVNRENYQEDGTLAEGSHHLLGESWDTGRVIISWDHAEEGGKNFSDGRNVVLHEFAHQLDSASGITNGAPVLRDNSYQTWAEVFTQNFKDLRSRTRKRKRTVMDGYGATNEAEFFAVATETFFEKPRELEDRRPELFEELKAYYQLDPREWT